MDKNKSINNEKAERQIIGGVIGFPKSLFEVVTVINKPEVFFYPVHQVMFAHVMEMSRNGENIDMLTVAAHIRKHATKDEQQLMGSKMDDIEMLVIEMTSEVVSTVNITEHCRIVVEHYLKRRMVEIGHLAIRFGMNEHGDVFEQLDELRAALEDVDGALRGDVGREWKDVLDDTVEDVKRVTESDGALVGIPTGFKSVNEMTGGWQPGLHIIGARPGMGKTALVMRSALTAAKAGQRVLLFSLEMTDVQMAKRAIANETNIHSNMLFQEGLKKPGYWDKFLQAVNQLGKYPMEVIQCPGIDVDGIKFRAIREQRKKGVGLIIVDYLQIIEGSKGRGNREQEVSDISRGLKQLSLHLGVPVIALSQLGREVDKRSNKRPILADLRESGAIEQDADSVSFLYREHYYVERGMMRPGDGPDDPEPDDAEFIVAKFRNGLIGNNRIKWDGNRVRFWDPDTDAGPLVPKMNDDDDDF